MTATEEKKEQTEKQEPHKTVRVRIQRQDGFGKQPYWHSFDVKKAQGMNIISALQEIRRNPKTTDGKTVPAIVWDCCCLEEICGACTMVINGSVRQACSTLIDNLQTPVEIQPMTKFPVIRDLIVDRKFMFDALKRINGWVEIQGTYDLGAGPKMDENDRQINYLISRCMTCGCCVESCPQFMPITDYKDMDPAQFIGPQAAAQTRLFNQHPIGNHTAWKRLDALMGPGGIADCGNAQNCVKVCPKEIPLTDAIADINWDVTVRWFKKLLGIGPNTGRDEDKQTDPRLHH